MPRPGFGWTFQIGIHGTLELAEDPGGGEQKRREADRCGDGASTRFMRVVEHLLNGFCAFGADQTANLADDLATGRFVTEDSAAPCERDEQQRRDRQDAVERQRGAESGHIVIRPLHGGGI